MDNLWISENKAEQSDLQNFKETKFIHITENLCFDIFALDSYFCYHVALALQFGSSVARFNHFFVQEAELISSSQWEWTTFLKDEDERVQANVSFATKN